MSRFQDVDWFRMDGAGAAPIGDGTIRTTTTYDSEDQVVTVTDDRGGVTGTMYDKAGRKRFLIHPQTDALPAGVRNVDEWRYDENGNVVKMLLHEYGIPDGAGGPVLHTYSVGYNYDDLNRETEIQRALVDGQAANTERWYDSLGNVLRELNPGTVGSVGTRFTVDSLGQVARIEDGYLPGFSDAALDLTVAPTNSDGLVTLTKKYDLAGNRVSVTRDDLWEACQTELRNTRRARKRGGKRSVNQPLFAPFACFVVSTPEALSKGFLKPPALRAVPDHETAPGLPHRSERRRVNPAA